MKKRSAPKTTKKEPPPSGLNKVRGQKKGRGSKQVR